MSVSEENIRLIFGLKLKKLRDENSMSLSDLSNASGLSISYLNEIERGKKYPKSDKIIALANSLDVSYDQLVSLKLTKGLSPIGELLNSDIIQELPFNTFGIDKSKLFEMIANAPAKITAFISTILEIARNYNMKQEHFYFASLRSYQELHDNYFDEFETAVKDFSKENDSAFQPPVVSDVLSEILVKRYKYDIKVNDFAEYPHLKEFRSVFHPGKKPILVINKKLTNQQRAFLFAKEVGFQFLKVKIRPLTFSWLKVQSFDQVLNNFKASYFAGALLINKESLIKDIEKWFKMKKWDGEYFLSLMDKYHASPEMFLHRLTNILPKFFGLNHLFFIRHSTSSAGEGEVEITKELHLSRTASPFHKNISEHLYRRWISKNVIAYLKKQRKEADNKETLIEVVRSKYTESGNEYFCLSILRPLSTISNNADTVTIGFVITDTIRKKIKFLNDKDIYFQKSDDSLSLEFAPPEEIQKEMQLKATEDDLHRLMRDIG